MFEKARKVATDMEFGEWGWTPKIRGGGKNEMEEQMVRKRPPKKKLTKKPVFLDLEKDPPNLSKDPPSWPTCTMSESQLYRKFVKWIFLNFP